MYGGSHYIVDLLNLVGRLLAGIGEVPNFLSDYGEALAGGSGVGGFHGGVQGNETGLLGDGENVSREILDLIHTSALLDCVV